MRRWSPTPRINGGLKLEGDYFEVDYADFVAWRAIGNSVEPVFNCFAIAALRGADGVFLLGEMASHTTNGGQIYFPAGTPDPSDVMDGKVHLEASPCRELLEETGVRAEEAIIGVTWTVEGGPRHSCGRTWGHQTICSKLHAKRLGAGT